MRYYAITVGQGQPASGQNQSTNSLLYYTSHPNGVRAPPIPGALDVELDVYVSFGHIIVPGSFIRVWGVSPLDIGPASTFGNTPLVVQGGMGVGLPLANPAQSGVLAIGTAWQVFGNWQDTNLTLDIVAVPPTGVFSPTLPGLSPPVRDVVLHWTKGQQLSDAITSALKTAYPEVATIDVSISQNLKRDYDDIHHVDGYTGLARYVNNASVQIVNNPDYSGVAITFDGAKFVVRDFGQGSVNNSTSATVTVQFQDLIGQPTWIRFNVIQFQTVMRADIDVGVVVAMPPAQFTSTPGSFATPGSEGIGGTSSAATFYNYRQVSAFGGNFRVQSAHHVGRFRAPDGRQWCTVFEAWLVSVKTATGDSYLPTDISQPAGSA